VITRVAGKIDQALKMWIGTAVLRSPGVDDEFSTLLPELKTVIINH
jgi:hypothetical protein